MFSLFSVDDPDEENWVMFYWCFVLGTIPCVKSGNSLIRWGPNRVEQDDIVT